MERLRNVDWGSLRVRLVLGLGALLLVLTGLWSWQGWRSDTARLRHEACARLEALAATTAVALDADVIVAHARRAAEGERPSNDLHDTLADVLAANGLEGRVRVLLPRADLLERVQAAPDELVAGALERHGSSEEGQAAALRVDYAPAMGAALLEGHVVSEGPVATPAGSQLAAYAPLVDSFGGTVGLVQAELPWSAARWKAALLLALRLLGGGVLGAGALAGANALVRRSLAPLARLEQAAGELALGHWSKPVATACRTSELVVLASALEGLRVGVAARLAEEERQREELGAATRALEENLASRSAVLARLGSELREPLGRFTGELRALGSVPLDGEARQRVASALQSGYGLSRAVEHALQLARLESGGGEGVQERFDLAELIERVAAPARARAREAGLALRVVVPETLPASLVGDPGAIREVLEELLANALSATSEGSVTLRVWRTPSKEEAVFLRFEVADTGRGVAVEEAGRVEQALRERMEFARREGARVGLARASELVHLHGGELAFESRPGAGSRFWFFARFALPVAARAPSEPAAALPSSARAAPPRSAPPPSLARPRSQGAS